ncbi:hypothetical protein Amet_3266 [Alkaliphilus metalliredigens QYMF]|uniref:Uncharacterized protein n=1 Tax=Alkaliphilus metalliredigens (strain QYMF) TaxID=293826 RepID=A6TT86_ALKMQ|nr:CC/Se motif family (seleno)protein [Alkaliphilus metalliredigens]ABR49404.1 hypothetical protein Amet_3266 [Alkaliphilus metalliredigens QYMF]
MEFQIESEAKAYIVEKNQAIMIMLSSISGCCGGAAPMAKEVNIGLSKLFYFKKLNETKITSIFNSIYYFLSYSKFPIEALTTTTVSIALALMPEELRKGR